MIVMYNLKIMFFFTFLNWDFVPGGILQLIFSKQGIYFTKFESLNILEEISNKVQVKYKNKSFIVVCHVTCYIIFNV